MTTAHKIIKTKMRVLELELAKELGDVARTTRACSSNPTSNPDGSS